jgi:arsenite oxidase small subunit
MPEAQTPAVVSAYPRKLIAKLSDLKVDEPFDFEYPDEGGYAESILVKLGKQAGGGLCFDKDEVAFNHTCTHQGAYQAADKALGPCPVHLTTFDLTRQGIFIAGQAYQSPPQALLELEGDDIYAGGMFGLLYGRFDNLSGLGSSRHVHSVLRSRGIRSLACARCGRDQHRLQLLNRGLRLQNLSLAGALRPQWRALGRAERVRRRLRRLALGRLSGPKSAQHRAAQRRAAPRRHHPRQGHGFRKIFG